MISQRMAPNVDALHLVRGQILPRLPGLLRSSTFWLSVASAILLTLVAQHTPFGTLSIREVIDGTLTYASISLGACVSATVLALGLPGTERIRRWSTVSGSTPGMSLLSDLVFVLTWAALAQIALILTCVVSLVLGGELPIAPRDWKETHAIGLLAGSIAFFYALFQLLVVVQTLLQIGVVVIAEENADQTTVAFDDR